MAHVASLEYASPSLLPKYIPQLDGLRGVAILMVLASHFSMELNLFGQGKFLRIGWTGVDLFFVLSGFLITTILLGGRAQGGLFFNFYCRRILRIWPLYFAVLLLTLGLFPLIVPHGTFGSERHNWPYYVFFIPNILLMHDKAAPLALTVTWSLGIEEQFYLIWPTLVYFLSDRALRFTLVLVLASEPLVRLLMLHRGYDLPMLYFNSAARLDGVAAGCLVALCLHTRQSQFRRLRFFGWASIAVAPICFLVVGNLPASGQHSAFSFSLISIVFAGWLSLALSGIETRNIFSSALSVPWLAYGGKISYGIYLLHMIVSGVVWRMPFYRHPEEVGGALGYGLIIGALEIGGAVAAATLSWYMFERHFLKLKRYFSGTGPR